VTQQIGDDPELDNFVMNWIRLLEAYQVRSFIAGCQLVAGAVSVHEGARVTQRQSRRRWAVGVWLAQIELDAATACANEAIAAFDADSERLHKQGSEVLTDDAKALLSDMKAPYRSSKETTEQSDDATVLASLSESATNMVQLLSRCMASMEPTRSAGEQHRGRVIARANSKMLSAAAATGADLAKKPRQRKRPKIPDSAVWNMKRCVSVCVGWWRGACHLGRFDQAHSPWCCFVFFASSRLAHQMDAGPLHPPVPQRG